MKQCNNGCQIEMYQNLLVKASAPGRWYTYFPVNLCALLFPITKNTFLWQCCPEGGYGWSTGGWRVKVIIIPKTFMNSNFGLFFFFFSRQNSQSTVRCLISYLTDCHESYDPQMITNDFCDPLPFLQRQQVNALTYTNTFVISYHKFRKIYFFFIFIL